MSTLRSPAVTGATGFIGQRLISRLCEGGLRPRALVRPTTPVPKSWAGSVDVCLGDVTDRDSVRSFMDGASELFHLAARVGDWGREEDFQSVTVGGSRNVLEEAAVRGTRTILVSSIVVYGTALGHSSCSEDQTWGTPSGMYSRAKQAQERLAWDLAHTKGLSLSVVRPANVFGPHSGPWVDSVIQQLSKGLPSLIGKGKLNASLVYVENLVDLLLTVVESPDTIGKAYNACDGLPVTWEQYFGDLAKIVGAPAPRSMPVMLAKTSATACEAIWGTLRLAGRPPVTHEALSLVCAPNAIPNHRAVQELGCSPRVQYPEALAAIAASLTGQSPRSIISHT